MNLFQVPSSLSLTGTCCLSYGDTERSTDTAKEKASFMKLFEIVHIKIQSNPDVYIELFRDLPSTEVPGRIKFT